MPWCTAWMEKVAWSGLPPAARWVAASCSQASQKIPHCPTISYHIFQFSYFLIQKTFLLLVARPAKRYHSVQPSAIIFFYLENIFAKRYHTVHWTVSTVHPSAVIIWIAKNKIFTSPYIRWYHHGGHQNNQVMSLTKSTELLLL